MAALASAPAVPWSGKGPGVVEFLCGQSNLGPWRIYCMYRPNEVHGGPEIPEITVLMIGPQLGVPHL